MPCKLFAWDKVLPIRENRGLVGKVDDIFALSVPFLEVESLDPSSFFYL